MYLVCDYVGNVYKKDIKGLKQLLFEEIIEHARNNYKEKDFIYDDLDMLTSLFHDKVNVFKELENYGWFTKDLMQLHRDLYDFKEYMEDKYNKSCEEIRKVLDMIESELK